MDIWISLIVSMVSGGLSGAIVRYILDVVKSRNEYAMRLHREWWSSEFHSMRSAVYAIVEDLKRPAGPGDKAKEFLQCVESGDILSHPAGAAFVQIVVFFADINACLDRKLISGKFAYRLFGEAQFYWFKPLIDAVRSSLQPNRASGVRWSWETASLEQKFDRFRKRDEGKRSRLLAK